MTKSELIAEIQNNLGDASKADAEKALSAVLASIKTAVKKAGKTVKVSDKAAKDAVAVQLVGFGTFSVAGNCHLILLPESHPCTTRYLSIPVFIQVD